MDFKQLLRDKRVWAGAAVVAAVAVVAVVRGRGSAAAGTTSAAVPGSGANPYGSYLAGSGDTTGANLASFLGNWGQANLDAQAAGFQSIIDALQKTPTDAQNNLADYLGGGNVNEWLAQVNAANAGLNLTIDKLKALNPSVVIRQSDAYGFLGEGNRRGGPIQNTFWSPSGQLKIR